MDDDSLFARLGWDPVRIFTVMNGGPPPPCGIARLNPRLVLAESGSDPPPPVEEGTPQEGEGALPPDEPPAPPPAEEGDLAQAAPTDPPAAALADSDPKVRAWLAEHWDTLEALALANEAPQRPPEPEPEPVSEPEPEPAVQAEPPPPPPPVHVRKGDRWNKPKMVDFLRQLAATQSVTAAARSVGMSRVSAYRLRNRLKGQPFDIAWEAAFRHGYDNLAHAALDRALNGVEVPHYCNGKLVGTSRKFDERLTVALLAMRNRVGAPMLGRFGAAAEFWGEHWDQLLERIGSGPVDWSTEEQALAEPERQRLELPDAERDLLRVIARNAPDDRGGGSTQ